MSAAAGAGAGAGSKKTRLDFVVEELLGNETTYRSDLARLVESFVPAFRRYATDPRVNLGQRVDDDRVVTQLFGQFQGLRDLNDKMWEHYETILRSDGQSAHAAGSEVKVQAFCEALAHAAPFFRIYASYARSLGERDTGSLAILHRCSADVNGFASKVETMLAAAGLSTHMQVIENVMVKPCQYLMRYALILNEVKKELEKSNRMNEPAAKAVIVALEAIRKVAKEVDKAKGAIDSAELINMMKQSSTLAANFELVTKTRHILDRFPCWVLSGDASGLRTAGQLTLCNDCVILDRRFAFGRATMEILHVFRSLSDLHIEASCPRSPTAVEEANPSPESPETQVFQFRDTCSFANAEFHVEISTVNHGKLMDQLSRLCKQHEAKDSPDNGGGHRSISQEQNNRRKLPRLRIVPNASIAYGASSQMLMPLEVAWFSIFCVFGIIGRSLFPDAEYHESTIAWAMNRLVLKKVGYFVPLLVVQAFHFARSRSTFWTDFVCTDLIGWLYVYTFTRFLFEPAVHVGSSAIFGSWMSEAGVSSHLLMTYVSWGYALLVSDFRWFLPPDRPFSHPDARREWTKYLSCAIFFGVSVMMYTFMAFITSRYFHNTADWLVAGFTASVILGILSWIVRNVRESQQATQHLLLRIVACETVLVLGLMIYDRWEGLGETGHLEVLISKSLRYAFWVNPIEGFSFYLVVVVASLFGSFLQFSFLNRHGTSEWIMASREAACALPFALGCAVLFLGNNNVFRASICALAANVLAAQGRSLLTKHANAIAHVGEANFDVGGGDPRGFFALVVRTYENFIPQSDAVAGDSVVVLRPVAFVMIWALFMFYNQVIGSIVVQAAHAELQLHESVFLSFGTWLGLMAAMSVGYHVFCKWVEDRY